MSKFKYKNANGDYIPLVDINDVEQTFNATSENPQSGKAVAEALTHIDVSNKEDKSNKVNVISSDSTDTQYPSAKAVYDAINSAIYDAMNTEY